jgi:hypothetical protein
VTHIIILFLHLNKSDENHPNKPIIGLLGRDSILLTRSDEVTDRGVSSAVCSQVGSDLRSLGGVAEEGDGQVGGSGGGWWADEEAERGGGRRGRL